MFVAAKLFHKAGEGSGGGSDPHNLGFYADLTALQTAHATGADGDFAILGSTDTVWVWDSGTSAWKDTDTKGQVSSVNNYTGAVSLDINDVAPTQTGHSGRVLGTDGFVAGWVKPEIVQVSALPAASEDEVDNIYQFIGTTDANYTNGYFYKCVSDGQNPATYSWTQTDVQPSSGGLPSQTGNAGKFLTTDGTDASWYDYFVIGNNGTALSVTITPPDTSSYTNVCLGHAASTNSSWGSTVYGGHAHANGNFCTVIGSYAGSTNNITYATAVGNEAVAGGNTALALGSGARAMAANAIQLGSGTNSTANSMNVSLGYYNGSAHNVTLLTSDETIPTDRFTTTPSADGTYVPTLTISSGVATRSWAAPGGGGSTAATGTLVAADWSSSSQTINVTGVTASNNVIVAPAPASQADYTSAGIICTAQGAGTLTFTCTSTPSSDLTVNVLII